jgi:hypothetical protein
MTDISITPLEPGTFGVEVTEGDLTTGHKVRVEDALLEELGLAGADRQVVVQETMKFLLEREPATSILSEFSLEDVSRYFPEFTEELPRRLSA